MKRFNPTLIMSQAHLWICPNLHSTVEPGVGTVVCPMYLSEIAPIRKRGSVGTMNQMGIVMVSCHSFIL